MSSAGVGDLVAIQRRLRDGVDPLSFGPPVTHVYNPLRYAWRTAEAYLRRYGRAPTRVLFLGMNPGPWGMAQTGVPFGDAVVVRDWLRIPIVVGRPARPHPRRPVLGADCVRREVSGKRFWGWARERFGTPEAFFQHFTVINYCPLLFLVPGSGDGARNLTPDQLPAAERKALFRLCDDALAASCEALSPELVIGVGEFAFSRARAALPSSVRVGKILHPSPRSPQANRDWAGKAEGQLRGQLGELGRVTFLQA